MLVDGLLLRNTPLLLVQGEYNSVRSSINNRTLLPQVMPTGLKQTSSSVSIGFRVDESAANTFTQSSVDLNLSPLDREVFVVTAINLDPTAPDAVDKQNTATAASLTTTSQTGVVNLADPNCLATANLAIRAVSASGIAVSFTRNGMEPPPATLDYI